MSKKIALVGHCGPDSSYLRMVIGSAAPGAQVIFADDRKELADALAKAPELILLNREVGYGFDGDLGVDLVRKIREGFPGQKVMLVSNYADAQAAAVAEGALPGFGKREIGSARVVQLLKDALG